jgi:hypothetical protein
MLLSAVMDELGTALDTIDGLRVYPYNAEKVMPPAAVVGWPDPLTYDATYGRGGDRVSMPLVVVVGRLDARTTRDRLAKYLDGTGAASVKATLESDDRTYTAFDSVRVTEARVLAYTIAGAEYFGAEFTLDIIGKGGA